MNSHFKRFIVRALLDSPAWVHLLDSVLGVIAEGGSFLHRFSLFLGFDHKTGVKVEELPSPVGDYGFNPVWLDFPAVKDLLDTQGFAEDFMSSLEMLPTGLGRLNCTSPYMFFKVLNALGIDRSYFSFVDESFRAFPNTRKLTGFLWLTGYLGDNTYTYRSISPLMDGDSVLKGSTSVTIVSYSTEMLELASPTPLGLYDIDRSLGLFPVLQEGEKMLLWSYPDVPSQLVYTRYSPLAALGTSLVQLFLSALSVKCEVAPIELEQKFWLVLKSKLDSAFAAGDLTDSILDSLQIPQAQYKFDNTDWAATGFLSGVVKEFVVLTKWEVLPLSSFTVNAWVFDITPFNDLFPISDYLLATEQTPSRVIHTSEAKARALALRLPAVLVRDVDLETISLFDASSAYSFGVETIYETIFRWTPTSAVGGTVSGIAQFGGLSKPMTIPAYSSLWLSVTGNKSVVKINGVVQFSVNMNQSELFSGFTSGMVHYFRYKSKKATTDGSGVFFGGVLQTDIPDYDSGFPFVSMLPTQYKNPHTGNVCGTLYTLSVFSYGIPFAVLADFFASWGMDSFFIWHTDVFR